MRVSFAKFEQFRRAGRTLVIGAVALGAAAGSGAFAVGAPARSSAPTVPTVHAQRLGVATGAVFWGQSASSREHELADLHKLGVRWVRTLFPWDGIERKGPGQDQWAKADAIVNEANRAHISLIAQVIGAPAWAVAGGLRPGKVSDYGSDPARYARFVATFARRYAPKGVRVFELGNEPNHVRPGNPTPNARTYAALLCATHRAVRAAVPNGTVLNGGLGGTKTAKGEISGPTFLRELYANGARGCFDGLSYHPYTYPQLAPDNGTRGWSGMLSARQAMVDHGDAAKKVWATEYGAPTNGPIASHFSSPFVSGRQQTQASILTNGYRVFDSYSWAGPMCWFDYQDKGTDPRNQENWFGLRAHNGAPKPAYAAYAALGRTAR